MSQETVAILVPAWDTVDTDVFRMVTQIAGQIGMAGYRVITGVTKRAVVHTARQWLAAGMLEAEADWGFWIDDDMVIPTDAPVRMLEWCKANNEYFATGVYFQRKGLHRPLILRRIPDLKYEDEWSHHHVLYPRGSKAPFKIDAAGFGCMLTHRKVIEAVPYPRFAFINWTDSEGKQHEASEDFYFCVQARKAGFDLWAFPDIECGHQGEKQVVTREDCEKVMDRDKIEGVSGDKVKEMLVAAGMIKLDN